MKIGKREIITGIVLLFIVVIMNSFYYDPAVYIAKGQGTVLDDNWWNAMNWIKNNTEECAVIATYWDPGHFITGIANRPVVFDGASQGAGLTLEMNGTNVTYSRIQDIATTLFTDDEEKAVEILKKYKKSGCDEMYYIASADLIAKSQWWTYFSTWDKVTAKGTMYYYRQAQLTEATPLLREDAISYRYYAGTDDKGQDHFYVIYEKDNALIPMYQIGNQFFKISKIINLDDGKEFKNDVADIPGTVLVVNKKQILIHIPPELENSLFTRMFFYSGQGLTHFQFVNNWGGEVKLFKVVF
jgi:dolichyl-diphosphooligosaccharide--protein glycosyltransferase